MARAEVASASAHSDSIKGLAQSIARPAYRRLLIAEPALRRAVPALIIAFLLTIGVGAIVQVLDHRRQAISEAIHDIDNIADFASERFDRLANAENGDATRRDLLERALTVRATAFGRRILLSNADAIITATAPAGGPIGDRLLEVIGDTPLTILGASAGVLEITLADGNRALAAVRTLAEGRGQLTVFQMTSDALATWRSDTTLTVTLSATTGFVLLILGFAFHWQATRAREADVIYDTVRSRIDTALNRGRCGLWDWDLARGRIFWSHSMFAILGLPARDDLLTFGEVSRLVHPEDIKLYEVAAQLADARASAIDHEFRMHHASGKWVWLRARCELVRQPNDSGVHLIGIAVDITEQKTLVERTAAADLRLRDAIETIPEAFVLWDNDNRLVLCNSNFQALHNLPDGAVMPGTAYDDVVLAGRRHVIRSKLANEDKSVPGARTFEAELDDGHWLQISERRTKDGGYVSVGTDITPLKRHETKLVDSEQRLLATVNDLRQSQQKLQFQARQLAELAQSAEEANQAKSKFLANMSHELRTPLNAIIGFSEIMESGMFGALGASKYHEYCRDIHRSGLYLLDVINDVLDMSKIEAGRFKLDLEDIELDRELADALRVISARANEKHLQVTSKIAPNIRFHADRRAFKQIALNLLSNAVKFTPEKGRITLRGRISRGAVVIGIQDSGIGIARHSLRKLGRPFEQVESQLTKTHHGSGLGLAIAKSLVELHGGEMRIRSALGQGTTVVVRWPINGRVGGLGPVGASETVLKESAANVSGG
jgi:two-component system cell cycle sensor histidine kinase PleC